MLAAMWSQINSSWRSRSGVNVCQLLELVPCWAKHLSADPDDGTVRQFRRHETTGRPAGSERFLQRLETIVGRLLGPQKPGRKKKHGGE
jgi:putative transposase